MKNVFNMQRLFFIALLFSAACQTRVKESTSAPVQATLNDTANTYTIEQFMNTTRLGGSAFSPDEKKIMFSSNQTGIFNAFEIPAEGGTPVQLTKSADNSVFIISYFPADERILFSSDQGGNENTHIYLRKPDGATQDLTPGDKAKSEFMRWSKDDKSFFYISNKRDSRYFDLYEMDIASFTPRLVFKNDKGYEIEAISDDKQMLALAQSITTNNSNMFLHDLRANKTTLLSKHEGDAQFRPLQFTPDNKQLLYLSNEKGEFMDLSAYTIADGSTTLLEKADWDVSYAYLSRHGKYRVVFVNNDARTEVRVYTTADNKRVELPAMPAGDITSVNISRSEEQMAFYVNSSKSPNSLYVYDFGSRQHRELVNAMNPDINPNDLVAGTVIRYASFDGMEIPALLYTPKGTQKGAKHPAMLWIHGGPGGQSRLTYNPLIQYLVNNGYVVLAVNNRGSSGYGKTFFAADDRKHGDEDLRDCIESKKFLEETGFVDPQRIGIMGGSYGGYMTLAALTFAPDEFAVGVNIFGVSNWLRTLNSIPPYWESFREALYKEMGHPVEDSVALYNKSPLFHAHKIKKPLMVLQGANDPRVLKIESDEIVEAAKKNNVPVEYVVFEDEGHGFQKKENEIKGYSQIRIFLDKYLKKKAS
jgi:dipeptidyl aminopeptidase/acylaminoacyl peptidase